MKGRIFGVSIILSLAVIAIIFGAVFPYARMPENVSGAGVADFKYIHGDDTSVNSGYKGIGKTSLGRSAYFSVTAGTKDGTTTKRPVFSNSEMDAINNNRENAERDLSSVDGSGNYDGKLNYNFYGFVMLDDYEKIFVDVRMETTGVKQEQSGSDILSRYGTFWRKDGGARNWGTTGIIRQDNLDLDIAWNTANNLYTGTAAEDIGRVSGYFDAEGFYEFVFVDNDKPRLCFAFYIVKQSNVLKWPNELRRYNDLVDEAIGGGHNQFYNGYSSGKIAYISFDKRYFDVTVDAFDASGLPMGIESPETEGNITTWKFLKIGTYVITSRIYYKVGTNNVRGNYADCVNRLSVYGIEAFYENYDFNNGTARQASFGGVPNSDGIKVESNVTGFISKADYDFAAGTPDLLPGESGYRAGLKETDDWGNWRLSVINNLNNKLLNPNFVPAITNSPPVQLRGNVYVNFGVIYYNKTGELMAPNAWVRELSPYKPGRMFFAPGLYFVALNYKNPENIAGYSEIQCFYFKITNGINPRIEIDTNTGTNEVRYFNDYASGYIDIPAHKNAVIFLTSGYSGTKLGPYEIAPSAMNVTLSQYSLGDGKLLSDELVEVDPIDGRLKIPQSFINAIYVFRVKYGNNYVSSTEFVVVVDRGIINGLEFQTNGTQHDAFEPEARFQYFGGNDPEIPTWVSVEWQKKDSDKTVVQEFFTHNTTVGKYKDFATVKFYPFVENGDYYKDASGAPKYTDSVTGDNGIGYGIFGGIYAKSSLSLNPIETLYPVKYEDMYLSDGDGKWHIYDVNNKEQRMKFTEGGLYIVSVTDTANITTIFGFIIDNTEIGWAQNPKPNFSTGGDSNIVDATSVQIGFGKYKVIYAQDSTQSIYTILEECGLWNDYGGKFENADMINSNWGVIKIKLNDAENAISDDGFVHNEVKFLDGDGKPQSGIYSVGDPIDDDNTYKKAIYDSGDSVITLTTEAVYYLRSVDAVGNIAEWYVWLNRDKSCMQVMEDDKSEFGSVSPTANLVTPDGMANMSYVTLRFNVSADGVDSMNNPVTDMYIVDKITATYYNFDFESDPIVNKNWPFAKEPMIEKRTIYEYDIADFQSGDTRDIPIMENNTPAPAGLYCLTRTYTYTSSAYTMTDEYDRKDALRNYFFVVDRNDVIPFKADPFESQIKMKFGDKTANYLNFRIPEPLHTNALGDLIFPANGSKYGGKIDLNFPHVTYNEAGFPQTVNNKKFKALLLTATAKLNEAQFNGGKKIEFDEAASGPWTSKPIGSARNTFTQSGLYALTIRDGSGGVKPMPITHSTRVTKSNSADIFFEIAAGTAPVFWYIGRDEKPEDKEKPTVKLEANRQFSQFQDGWRLEFGIENIGGDSDFYAEIDHPKTVIVLGDERGGITLSEIQQQQVDKDGNIIVRGSYLRNGVRVYENIISEEKYGNVTTRKYNLTNFVLLSQGSVFAQLYTVNNVVTIDSKILIFDNTPPKYNLAEKTKQTASDGTPIITTESIQKMDTLYANAPRDNIQKYVYSLSSDFVYTAWTPDETQDIYYREVNENLVQIVANFTKFRYYPASRDNGTGQTFASLMNLRRNEVRFFNITEYDEAGNKSDYYVKLRGADYNDFITITGSPSNRNLLVPSGNIFGTDIAVTDVENFWDANPNFKISYTLEGIYGNIEYRAPFERYKYNDDVLKDTYKSATAMKAFEKYLDDMLIDGRGKKIRLTYDVGYGVRDVITITQATDTTPRPQIITASDPMNGFLNISIKNRETLTDLYRGLNFYITIYSIENKQMSALPILDETQFNQDQTFEGLLSDKSYVIVVRDDFNRKTTAEHHSPEGLYCNIVYNGDHRWVDGVHYVGHPEGVRIEWNNNTYGLSVDGEAIEVNGKHSDLVTKLRPNSDIYVYSVLPRTNINDQSSHMATLNFRVSGGEWNGMNRTGFATEESPILDWPAAWTFYFVLPELQFRTINGTGIDPADLNKPEGIKGMVEVTLDRRGFIFQTYVDYVIISPDGTTENLQINRFATRFILDRVGIYRIRISNDVSASRTVEINISEVDNLNYKIRNFKDSTWVDLDESPELFDINSVAGMRTITGDNTGVVRNVPVYWFSSGNAAHVDVKTTAPYTNAAGTIEIVPTLNQNRKLENIGNRTTIDGYTWKYYYLENTATHVRMYFVLACTATIGIDANLIDQNSNSTITGTHLVYSSIPREGIKIKLQTVSANKDATDPRRTNVYYAEYSHNSVIGGRAFGGDVIRVEKADYGIIELRVRDWAGNVRLYGTHDCFTLYNFSVPPVLIRSGTSQNFETIVDEMVYNASFTLTAITQLPDYIPERNEYYFIRQLRVWRDGVLVEEFKSDSKHAPVQFGYSETGRYVIECVYTTYQSGAGVTDVVSTHTIQLVNPAKFMQSFMFSGASNIQITAVIFGGKADITNQFGSAPLNNVYISPEHGEGRYTLVFAVSSTNLRSGYTFTRELLIAPLYLTRAAVSSTHKFGNEYKENVSIMFKPIDIMRICNSGTATLTVYRDGKSIERIDISTDMTKIVNDRTVAQDINETMKRTYGDVGQYTIVVAASNGTTVFVDGFTITQSSNTTLVGIGIGASIAFVALIILFIRLRSKMRVR